MGNWYGVIRHWWEGFILGQWEKYFQVGGHCGLCGKWIPDAVVPKSWAITMCYDWETACFNTQSSVTKVKKE